MATSPMTTSSRTPPLPDVVPRAPCFKLSLSTRRVTWKRWANAEGDAREATQAEREEEHGGINVNFFRARQGAGYDKLHEGR